MQPYDKNNCVCVEVILFYISIYFFNMLLVDGALYSGKIEQYKWISVVKVSILIHFHVKSTLNLVDDGVFWNKFICYEQKQLFLLFCDVMINWLFYKMNLVVVCKSPWKCIRMTKNKRPIPYKCCFVISEANMKLFEYSI